MDCLQIQSWSIRAAQTEPACSGCLLLIVSAPLMTLSAPLHSPPPEVRRWGNLKETLLRFQRTHDFSAAFEALTEGELAGDYFNALGNHRQELLRQHVGWCLR